MASEIVTAKPLESPGLWAQQALLAAFGQGTPAEGMAFSLALFMASFLMSFPLPVTIIFDVILGFAFLFNFGRAVWAWWASR